MSWLRSIPFPTLQSHSSDIGCLHPGKMVQGLANRWKQPVPSLRLSVPMSALSARLPQWPTPNREIFYIYASRYQSAVLHASGATLSGLHTISASSWGNPCFLERDMYSDWGWQSPGSNLLNISATNQEEISRKVNIMHLYIEKCLHNLIVMYACNHT